MKIGIDLTPIQGPHRMRGIGYTLINLINNLPDKERAKHEFVFYALPDHLSDFGDPLTILDLHSMSYEVRHIQPRKKVQRKLPGRLSLVASFLNALKELVDLRFGDSRIKDLRGVDAFLQTDQSQSLPRKWGLKKILIVYDIIPYVLEWDYLWSYDTARSVYGYSRKAAFRCEVRRRLYALKLRLNIRRANKLLSISHVTEQDFLQNFKIKKNKISVTPLGTINSTDSTTKDVALKRYEKTSWGYLPRNFTIKKNIPYILFVGGADKRRKLQDVVTAFNNLRARGVEINLVLAGDSMKGPDTISTEEVQGALKTSSYLDDIIFLGFINDQDRDWLYRHALAFVFPSRYEGFGLPVLEAFVYKCPVISYRNDAVVEVAGKAPLYADDAQGVEENILMLLGSNEEELDVIRKRGTVQAQKYNWPKTSSNIFSIIDET